MLMTVYYENRDGRWMALSGISRLKKTDEGILMAITASGKEMVLVIDRIRMIEDGDDFDREITYITTPRKGKRPS